MDKQNILVVGSGGREHALIWKLAQSARAGKIYAAPGNGGTHEIAENVAIGVTEIDKLVEFAKSHDVYVTIIGPDDPLADGIVDSFEAAGLRVFGPTKAAAQIEASKAFSKRLMAQQGVPTAEFEVFDREDNAVAYVKDCKLPMVVKASGLALGKGVIICETHNEAVAAVRSIMGEKVFGAAGNEVVIEEYLDGQEISIHAVSDDTRFILFPSAQDHKPIHDDDKGPNTGGMGTYAPVPWVTPKQMEDACDQAVKPILAGLKASGASYSGMLYPGLKMTSEGLKVLEYNARFGDPETQVYMRLFKSDFLEMISACAEHRLKDVDVKWHEGFAACIVVASGGYPGGYEKGKVITGIEDANAQPDVVVFHAGTKHDGELKTSGGRVLNVTATGSTLQEALDKAYAAVELIAFEGAQYRTDIGKKSLPA